MIQLSKVRRYIFLIYIFLLPLFASNSFFGKIPFSLIFTTILLYLCLLQLVKRRKEILYFTFEDKLLLIFIFICIISIIFSNDIGNSFLYFIGLLPQILMYIFMKNQFKEEKIKIIKVLVLSSCMVAIINIWQVREAIKIYGYKSNDIFASINYYGSIVAFTIPLIIYLIKKEKKKVYYIILLINVFSSLLSFSKVALGLIGIYFIYYLYLIFRKKGYFLMKLIIVALIIIVISFGIKYISNNNSINNVNLNKMIENFISGESFESRKILNNVSENMIKDHLLTGVGIGNYKLSTYYYSELYYRYHPGSEAHDLMLSIFAEVGIFGIIIFIFILFRCVYIFKKNKEIDFFMYAIGVILSIAFYGVGLKNWYLWILIAMATVTVNMKGEKHDIKYKDYN